ncbi:MAG: DMT family transporter [Bacteroidota bacterium]
MYCISDRQIDFILNDIRRNGIELEDLQLNLLDHVCCIIEQEFEENGDFEQFYFSTVRRFYKTHLNEIEEETKSLLTFKHYYFMKKAMIISGVFSAAVLSIGIVLKFLHTSGASACMVLGIGSFSLVFLPLMATLKIKEKQGSRDKLLMLLGALSAVCICMAILFKLQYWPGANKLGLISVGILFVLFLPVYFISGIRQAETKINTIVSSILLVAGCGLFLALARTPQASYNAKRTLTEHYLRNEQLLKNERLVTSRLGAEAQQINVLCDGLKAAIIEDETGTKQPDWSNTVLSEDRSRVLNNNTEVEGMINELKKHMETYNRDVGPGHSLPLAIPLFDNNDDRTLQTLNDLVQIQLFVAQNQVPAQN